MIAIFLHFIYLEVFLTMLVQGINLALTVLRPLKKQRFGWQMIVASYGNSSSQLIFLDNIVIHAALTYVDGNRVFVFPIVRSFVGCLVRPSVTFLEINFKVFG